MIKWKFTDYDDLELVNLEACRSIAEQLERFNNFIKYASVGGMGLTAVYFMLKIVGVF